MSAHFYTHTRSNTGTKPYASTIFYQVRSLVVWPEKGYLYYAEWSLSPFIGRMAMDGSEFTKLGEGLSLWPKALAVDHYSQRLFFADSHNGDILYMNYDGTNRHHAPIKEARTHVNGLAMFESYVYWTEEATMTLSRARKYSLVNETVMETYNQPPESVVVSAREHYDRCSSCTHYTNQRRTSPTRAPSTTAAAHICAC